MLRRLSVGFAVVILAQAILAQVTTKSLDSPDKTKKPPGNCSVSGRVVGAADGVPLRWARVGLIQANAHHPQVYATTTDNEGHFEIKLIEAGRYEFFASHVGYLEQHYQVKGTEEGEGAVLALVSGQEVTDVLFRMVRAAVIMGKVVDDSGEPMVGVNVSVLHKPTEEEREEEGPRGKKLEMTSVSAVPTDDRGEYRIFGLKPGDYYVKAVETSEGPFFWAQNQSGSNEVVLHELGSQFAPIFYPGVLQMDQAQAVTLSAGEEAQADLAMRRIKLVEVAGKVIGPDGSPGVRSYVQLSQVGISDWSGELGGGTDSKGEFSIKGVPPGSYFVSASMREKDKYYNTRQKVEVVDAKIDSIVLVLGSGATIHGRLAAASGAPVPTGRVRVHLSSTADEGSSGFAYAEVNKDGSFELDSVSDGSYALGTAGLEQGWFVKSVHLGSEDVLLKGVQVENGAVAGRLDIVVSSDGAQIEGTITDSDNNQPMAGVLVSARVDPETDFNRFRSRQSATDQNGHFVLKDVPPGKYKVSAKMSSSGTNAQAIKSEPVEVSVGERERRVLDIKLTVPKSE